MSKITIDRELLEKAIESMDGVHAGEHHGGIEESIAALREALDQPQQEPVPPELFAQQIAAAMRFADAPLTHDQFVTLVLYLKARCADNAEG